MTDFNEELEKIKRALSEVPRLKYADISLTVEGICYALDALKLPTCETCSNGQFAYKDTYEEDWYKCDDVIVDGTATHRWDFYCANHEPKEMKV